jgi:hypothetical protein
MGEYINKHNGKPYEKKLSQLALAKFKGNKEEDLEYLFCSELTVSYLKVKIIL